MLGCQATAAIDLRPVSTHPRLRQREKSCRGLCGAFTHHRIQLCGVRDEVQEQFLEMIARLEGHVFCAGTEHTALGGGKDQLWVFLIDAFDESDALFLDVVGWCV